MSTNGPGVKGVRRWGLVRGPQVMGAAPGRRVSEAGLLEKLSPGPSSHAASQLATGAFLCACVTAASHHPHQMPNQGDHLILEFSLQNHDKANCLRYSTVGHTQQLREKKTHINTRNTFLLLDL